MQSTDQTPSQLPTFAGMWVRGTTLMIPQAVQDEVEATEPMDLGTYRLPHAQHDPDSPNRNIEVADKW